MKRSFTTSEPTAVIQSAPDAPHSAPSSLAASVLSAELERQRLPRPSWRAVAVLATCLVAWLSLHHGALRSPDCEVQGRACAALATTGSTAVAHELPWRGFGLATGTDGGRYSVFGPLQPLLCAPWWSVASAVSGAGAVGPYPDPPRNSLYAGGAISLHIGRAPVANPNDHRMRAWLSLFNVGVCLALVAAFAWLAQALVRPETAWTGAALLGLGTLVWPFAGTFFSEPLATLFDMLAFGAALRVGRHRWASAVSGSALGLAVSAHVTAVLFLPAVATLVWLRSAPDLRRRAAAGWILGLAVPLLALGAFNAARFGSPWETGRGVDPRAAFEFGYGHFVDPWRGLFGLTLGAGKGLLWYAPLCVVGLACIGRLARRERAVAWILGLSVASWALVIAARSDWHGGFGPGPRLLFQLVPLCLLPLLAWVDTQPERRAVVAALAGLAAMQQAFFVLGEPFAFLQLTWHAYEQRGLAAFAGDRIYFDWIIAPVLHLHAGPPGPWWSRAASAGDESLALPILALSGLATAALVWWVSARPTTAEPEPSARVQAAEPNQAAVNTP
ncbi:MAG: hypothetical protein EXR79_17400 [Myxococcales bacterium]|nr:hypothetical protein [Myxococcales bacterium]